MALPLPPEIKYGRIRGRFLRSRSDTASDTDELPDGEPLQGTVTLTPFLYRQVTQLPKPTTILHGPQMFELNSGGYLVDPNSIDGAWVPTGIYEVSYSLVGGIIRNHVVEVTTAHTEIAPLDLSNAKPPDGTPLQPSQYAELDARLQILEGTATPTDHTHPDLISEDEIKPFVTNGFINETNHLIFTTHGLTEIDVGPVGGGGLPPGGTIGQVLAKSSSVDNDVVWVNPTSGGSDLAPWDGSTLGLITDTQLNVTESWADVFWQTADGPHISPEAPNGFTIPPGITRVRFTAGIVPRGGFAFSNSFCVVIYRDGESISLNNFDIDAADGYNDTGSNFISRPVDVLPGDYIVLRYIVTGSLSTIDPRSYFSMEVLEKTVSTTTKLTDLSGVSGTPPNDGETLVWDASAGLWRPGIPIAAATPSGVGFRGAMVSLGQDRSGKGFQNPIDIWDTPIYDTDDLWSALSPSRFTIPSGVTKVRLHLALSLKAGGFSSGSNYAVRFHRNGQKWTPNDGGQHGFTNSGAVTATPVMPVTPGDYIEGFCDLGVGATGDVNFEGGNTRFAIEIVEGT